MSGRRTVSRGYTPKERDWYGVTATLVDTETGDVVTFTTPGRTKIATQKIAAECDRLGPTWKVRTLSHPMSILTDLVNAGQDRPPSAKFTEAVMLGGIGRLDLVERDRLYARTADLLSRRSHA